LSKKRFYFFKGHFSEIQSKLAQPEILSIANFVFIIRGKCNSG